MMELAELLKRITTMQGAAKGRLKHESSELLHIYVQGFSDGLESVILTLKKAIEAERTRQRLAKLESELAQDPEPDWPDLPGNSPQTATMRGSLPIHAIDAAATATASASTGT